MTAPRDTGGPAFPSSHWPNIPGLSVRDYAAIHLPVPEGSISTFLAERLVGRPQPRPVNNVSADPMDHTLFWMEAEQAYRFLLADAFIAARAKV